MSSPIPASIRVLIDGPNYAHLSTVSAGGHPRNWVVWVAREDDNVLICTHAKAPKAKDMRRDPRVGLSITAFDNPYRMAALYERIIAADILVLVGPIWLGDNSSVMKAVIERLYGCSGMLNDAGQYAYYGRVAGCLITGNEDGVKHCAMNLLYSLQHLGYVIPPQADAGWVGPAGPGPSYLDEGSGGPDNDFTNRNTTFMTYNLMHIASLLRTAGGVPAYGNQRAEWDAGSRFGFANPEYR